MAQGHGRKWLPSSVRCVCELKIELSIYIYIYLYKAQVDFVMFFIMFNSRFNRL